MTQNHLQALYQQLLSFGLNPNDWWICPREPQTYEITKIDDPEFRFLGTIENAKWTHIWLISI